MRAIIRELADGFWTYIIACAGGLLFAWTLATPAGAEPVVLSFTDPQHCPPCRTLDRSWREAKPAVRRIVIDVRTAKQGTLAAWSVDCWPDTVLIELIDGKATKIYRRRVGSMTPGELLEFCEVQK